MNTWAEVTVPGETETAAITTAQMHTSGSSDHFANRGYNPREKQNGMDFYI